MQQTISKLLPQIRYWLRTGFVAGGKIISLHIPQRYSIVRGKVGKKVEFGLSWGIRRLRGGSYLLATLALDRGELQDTNFALRAVRDHIALFGKAPQAYAYDRGGYSVQNVSTLKKLGVKEVGLAPRGRTRWAVSGPVRDRLVKERALVEAGIGTTKSSRYGFNRPAARSVGMMGACGQRAVLGFNTTKLVRELAGRKRMVLTGKWPMGCPATSPTAHQWDAHETYSTPAGHDAGLLPVAHRANGRPNYPTSCKLGADQPASFTPGQGQDLPGRHFHRGDTT